MSLPDTAIYWNDVKAARSRERWKAPRTHAPASGVSLVVPKNRDSRFYEVRTLCEIDICVQRVRRKTSKVTCQNCLKRGHDAHLSS